MSETRLVEGSLRRTRSAGDIPSSDPRQSPSQFSPTFSSSSAEQSNDVHADSSTTGPTGSSTVQEPREEPIPIVQPSPPAPPRPATTHDPPRQHNRSLYSRTMAFFGYGRGASRSRRSLVSLVWNLSWGFTQIVIIITLLVLSGQLNSPTQPDTTEWHACNRPLGAWACLWIIRVILACILTWWGYKRDRQAQLAADPEAQAQNPPSTATQSQASHPTLAVTSSGNINRPGDSHTHTESPPLPYSALFKRLSLMSSFLSLSWFVTAHILEYTSVNTCRLSSPHIWWLILGILSITYLMILEVIILGFVVFIIAPIVFLVWNIFLMCIGRHPLQNPHMIKPEIGKLPKAVVDRIPLVMYIPPPPDAAPSDGPIKIPDAVYTYPPKPEMTAPASPKRRFKFLKFKSKPAANSGGTETSAPEEKKKSEGKEPQTWEDNWEQEGYPFVVLEDNRASCAICLLDFEEPRKVGQSSEKLKDTPTPEATEETNNENITEEERNENLHLKDAGDGPQPLRLLACGHVFHKPCLDPWLTDVSGRCPVCNRKVEIPEPTTTKKRKPR